MIPLTARGTMTWDYSRAGQRWDEAEDRKLIRGREDGYTVRELAIAHQRTCAGICTRLCTLGLMDPTVLHPSMGGTSGLTH